MMGIIDTPGLHYQVLPQKTVWPALSQASTRRASNTVHRRTQIVQNLR